MKLEVLRKNFFDLGIPTTGSDFTLFNLKTLPKFWRGFSYKKAKSKKLKENKRGIVTEYLPWIIISLAVLAIVMISIFMFREEGVTFIDKIKNLFRGR